ncbi:MAG TPA: type II toxin-antitoxin system RelE/ParE family toxin [Candidatus Dormibacteraeota bacterium]|jgi:hypothetical protein|nr:type II toxin-antitoxin system RelE/ParE family toxin [Candidatus Dormibacteraeota bacterium]
MIPLVQHRRQWRDYHTATGNRPVRDFIMDLPQRHRAEIVADMREVAEAGLAAARHLRGDIYEVRVDAGEVAYRILFATEGASARSCYPSKPSRKRLSRPAGQDQAGGAAAD